MTETDVELGVDLSLSVACECTAGYCHYPEAVEVLCGEDVLDEARCDEGAQWQVRSEYSCGMGRWHEEVALLCPPCLADLRECERIDGSVDITGVMRL
ncbi:hypothetical protein [Brevibacterium sp.]|uniref:hypothetical protein n=1 Tax=Brevibacterium sp. TaxID=1701 RepID=UPI0025B9EA7E|nr:hypothetical protein [Brevibacterium sp.]